MHLVLAMSALLAQAAGAPSQKEIDDAVKRGVEYLKTAPSTGGFLKGNCHDLILLTLLHGGMSDKNPVFKKLLEEALAGPLEHTYKVALHAMVLEDLDPGIHQMRIAQCAQFLIDNQASNGQWSYGKPTDLSKLPVPDKSVASGGGKDKAPEKKAVVSFGTERVKSQPKVWLTLTQQRTTGDGGDNSNSQYASLGLRACFDSKIKIPDNVIFLARKWWVEAQFPPDDGAGKDAVISGEGARAQGWNYKKPGDGEGGGKPTHAMTAGAVGACVIYEYMLSRDFRKDKVTKAGVEWLGKNFSVNTNYYYMYALERAGILYDVESFGGNNWYWKGVPVLLQNQNGDGSWGKREDKAENTWDTCFAILFLTRATKSVATGGGKR
ncbi:MAG TPA: hypothetical protein VF950_06765 [Planctomycetota bacterium]